MKAADAQGAVLPGVTVTLTSPVLVGAQVGVTDSPGVFRFLSLPRLAAQGSRKKGDGRSIS